MIKSKILHFAALILSVALLNGCDKDKFESWKYLPTAPISGKNATLTVNGRSIADGSVTLTAKSGTEGTLLLENMLPGYDKIEMDVTLKERSEGSFDLSGVKGLTTPPALTTKADAAAPAIFQVSVNGNVTLDRTISINMTSVLGKDAWKYLPATPISGEKATLTVNGRSIADGSVTLTAKSGTEGTLLLENMLPGYDKIEMDVTLKERSEGSFDLSGVKGLTTPPALTTKADAAAPAIFQVSADGNITLYGTISITMKSVLTKEAQGGLTGSWNLLTNLETDDIETATNLMAPVYIKWSALDKGKPNAELMGPRVSAFISGLVYQFLHSVTFSEEGNLTAEYWTADNTLKLDNIIDYIMNGIQNNKDHTATMINKHPESPWLKSPENVAYWYVSGEYLYVLPNITAILGQIGNNGGSALPDLTAILSTLGNYGIDVNELLPYVMKWMETGIPFKYRKTENGRLELYADKQMCRPIVEALLPALPKLDELIQNLATTSDNVMLQMLPYMLPSLLAIDNLAALGPIWKENTKDFEVSLNFEK